MFHRLLFSFVVVGQLAETLGFYAADWSGGDASKGEGGEGLTVVSNLCIVKRLG